ncbi:MULTISPECIES: hypothetical protein [Pseudoalteromonas]|jgi:LPS O-antigen subunit length determinant protein (WzzB/FepE family)|uniref:hypothetical protein n=1 Tax=Pseudoalteromonas TaxID=53246 RepID=UPI002359C425|nr:MULTISPECIES: hypothetical protein [Pseudoalteromonas]MCP4054763.1 hypothetical protein [Mesoflavibacter sp.]MDC9503223.1 hypothetical protein [Pseudoalteromonas sp. Angola-18]MDC9567038.1 hypothetical protein [Pseudoalteromonas sp. GAB2316C]MDC9571266.1 hypothetical protein [Pseudoalteromonas sp. GABNB9D]MDC9575494.1 hypothetical protein [Pseudoalteromonas sp. GABNS16A]|tara:strand:+ start:724 stop:1176 length:453 start_codon:yes stop_codon:yes gene_type:complete
MSTSSVLVSLAPSVIAIVSMLVSMISAMIAWRMRQHTEIIQLIEYKRIIRVTSAHINSLWNDVIQEANLAKVKSSTLNVDQNYLERIESAGNRAKKGQKNFAKMIAEYKERERDLTIKDAVEEILILEEVKISVEGDLQRIRNEFGFYLD